MLNTNIMLKYDVFRKKLKIQHNPTKAYDYPHTSITSSLLQDKRIKFSIIRTYDLYSIRHQYCHDTCMGIERHKSFRLEHNVRENRVLYLSGSLKKRTHTSVITGIVDRLIKGRLRICHVKSLTSMQSMRSQCILLTCCAWRM